MPEQRPAGFKVGELALTSLYGRAEVLTYWRDRNLGWVYRLRCEDLHGMLDNSSICALVESALLPVPVVDLLAELVE